MASSLCAVCKAWLPKILDDLFPEPDVFKEKWLKWVDGNAFAGIRRLYRRSVKDIISNKNTCWLCGHLYLVSRWLPDNPIQNFHLPDSGALSVEIHCWFWHDSSEESDCKQFHLLVYLDTDIEVGLMLLINLERPHACHYRKPSLQQTLTQPWSPPGDDVDAKSPGPLISTPTNCSWDSHQGNHEFLTSELCPCRIRAVKNWLNSCNKSHKRCLSSPSISPTSHKLPTRLIKVCEQLDKCRLIETASEPDAQDIVYATLSHCWGRDPIITLTRANYNEFRRRLPIRQLSRTFREALSICQSLGIKYLWIDSLCIIQDSKDGIDWLNEAPRMQRVYKGSFLNIAANASRKGSEGLIRPNLEGVARPFRMRIGETVTISFSIDEARHFHTRIFTESPLISRGWVLQELFLSPRKLYFTESQLIWQCNEHTWAEQLDVVKKEDGKIDYMYSNILNTISEVKELDDLWAKLLMDFCRMELTVPSDVLFALSGVATAFSRRYEELEIQTRYIAGCWEHDLQRYLQWFNSRPGGGLSLKHPLLPAWSCIRSLPTQICLQSLDTTYISPEDSAPPPLKIVHVHGLHTKSLGQIFDFAESLTVQVRASVFELGMVKSTSTSEGPVYRLCSYTEHVGSGSSSWCDSAGSSSSIVVRDSREQVHLNFQMDEEVDLYTGLTLICAVFHTGGSMSDLEDHVSITSLLLKLSTTRNGKAVQKEYHRVGKLNLYSWDSTADDHIALKTFFQPKNLPTQTLSLI